jgi:2-haloalkanoic acid dehalogenase type II
VTEPVYDVVTFDCYGTLVDWDAGIAQAFEGLAAGSSVSAIELRDAYGELEPVVEAEPYRRYRDVLAETAGRAAERFGLALTYDQRCAFAESLPGWAPFPDTNAALERLREAGYRLGLLSNTDEDLIAATMRHFTVPFDAVVTAERVRSYKPNHDHFLEARSRFAGARWLHAAQSRYHDIGPTRELGIPNAWINRRGSRDENLAVPDREFDSLASLAAWLAP